MLTPARPLHSHEIDAPDPFTGADLATLTSTPDVGPRPVETAAP
ncbi:hypothetical protein ACWCRF_37900 [Streptomyces sp. NPDC002405]